LYLNGKGTTESADMAGRSFSKQHQASLIALF